VQIGTLKSRAASVIRQHSVSTRISGTMLSVHRCSEGKTDIRACGAIWSTPSVALTRNRRPAGLIFSLPRRGEPGREDQTRCSRIWLEQLLDTLPQNKRFALP